MSCVYCGSTNNLNTAFNITIDDQKIQVSICDEHAEEATVKSAKEAYMKRQRDIDDFLAKAKELGLNISINNGISVVNQAPVAEEPPRQLAVPQVFAPPVVNSLLESDSGDVVDTTLIDNSRSFKSIGGSTQHGNVASYDSLKRETLTEKLDPSFFRGKAKVAVVEGRSGQPIAIPELRVDGTGTTRIQIVKKENDTKLQDRFKRMADDSRGDRTPDFARGGYENTMRNCPLCRGETVVEDRGVQIMCPKCGGSGIISIY